MNINESNLKELVESTGGDQTLTEGIKEIFQKFRLKKYLAKFLEKGNETVYFAYSKETGTFGKAVFESGKLVETDRYDSMDEMESEIEMFESSGYKAVKEAKSSRFIKSVVRNLGRLIAAGGIANFIAATLVGLGAGVGVLGAVSALPGMVVTFSLGWIFVKVAKKERALDRDYAGVARSLGEGTETSDAIRQLVRETIKEQSDEMTKTATGV